MDCGPRRKPEALSTAIGDLEFQRVMKRGGRRDEPCKVKISAGLQEKRPASPGSLVCRYLEFRYPRKCFLFLVRRASWFSIAIPAIMASSGSIPSPSFFLLRVHQTRPNRWLGSSGNFVSEHSTPRIFSLS